MLAFHAVTNADEIRQVAGMAGEIWREHFIPIIGAAQVDYMLEKFQSAAAISEHLRQGYGYYRMLVASVPVGYCAVLLRKEEVFLSKLYIRQEARGNGYARRAIDFLAAYAQAAGAVRITLQVNKRNSAAIAAYHRMGFFRVRSVVTDIGQGFIMDDYVLQKKIAEQQ